MWFIVLLVTANCGIPEFFEPQDPSTASILKHLDKYDVYKEQRFIKAEYRIFFYEVIYEELIAIGFKVTEEQREDLQQCIPNFVERDYTTYSQFMDDFSKEFISWMDDDDSRCPLIRGIWERKKKEKGFK
ncbi:hypothetical protein pb186bvf_016127 [Paramecium bursaria]